MTVRNFIETCLNMNQKHPIYVKFVLYTGKLPYIDIVYYNEIQPEAELYLDREIKNWHISSDQHDIDVIEFFINI